MSESSYPWNGTVTGDATLAPYDGPTTFAKYILEAAGHGALTNLGGVLLSELNELNPTLSSPNVSIDSGRAFVYGDFYESTGAVSFNIPTPVSSTRVDLIVVRKSWGAQTARLTRVAGTEGGGAPALTQVIGTTWDEPIAQASITTGGVITLTDTRTFVAPKTYASLGAPTVYDTNSGSPFTYNTPNAATAIRITAIGAGGGGQGITTGGSPGTVSGAGGGGGAAVESWIIGPAATYTIAIGVGGAGHVAAGAGSDGGDATVNTTLVVAKGGKGGGGSSQIGGAGGLASASTGDIKMNGEPGGSVAANSGAVTLPSGKGGSGAGRYGGGGGASVNGSSGPGQPGIAGGPGGGGGSGASAANATTSANGGAGHDGRVVIEAFH